MNRAIFFQSTLSLPPPQSYHRILPQNIRQPTGSSTNFSSSERCLFPRQRKLISPAVGNVLLPVIRGEGSPMKHIVKNVDILNPQSKDGPPIFDEVNPQEFQIGRFFDNESGCC